MVSRVFCWLLPWVICTQGFALGTLEFEIPVDTGVSKKTANLVIVFPDSIANVETRTLLGPQILQGTPILPRGKRSKDEIEFLKGLREMTAGHFSQAAETWSSLKKKRLEKNIKACLNVNAGLFLGFRGEWGMAESLWLSLIQTNSLAKEGAWRNLLGLYVVRQQWNAAQGLLEQVLLEQPRNRVAALAKAALIRQLKSDSDWEDFLRSKSEIADSMPDMQITYGEYLVSKKRYAEASKMLSRGLAILSRYGRGWAFLAEAQNQIGYHFFALECLENAFRAGYRESYFYELYAKVLRDCCMEGDQDRAKRAMQSAEKLLEEGLPKDLYRRSMAQLLYHIYCQNGKPDAAKLLQQSLWFHFQNQITEAPPLLIHSLSTLRLETWRLKTRFGLYSFPWVLHLQKSDFFQAF